MEKCPCQFGRHVFRSSNRRYFPTTLERLGQFLPSEEDVQRSTLQSSPSICRKGCRRRERPFSTLPSAIRFHSFGASSRFSRYSADSDFVRLVRLRRCTYGVGQPSQQRPLA